MLLEWARPKDQPWAGITSTAAPAAEVALRSEPRAIDRVLDPKPEYFDAPLASGGTLWR